MVSDNSMSFLLDNTHGGGLLAATAPEGLTLESRGAEFDATFASDLDEAASVAGFANALWKAKQAAGAVYAQNLVTGENNSEALGRFWSAFADWSINRALAYTWTVPAIARFAKEPPPGLFLLGLGKLGGEDLNYSSDVDLICFFESEAFTVNASAGKMDVAVRVLKMMTQILSGTHGPRIWRVDWRLRPDPSMTGLAMSASAGLDYFFFHAAPWRRIAMMKARVVAGDVAAGDAFLKELSPFLWRKSLDFRTVEEIVAIKARIRDDHPDLEGERQAETPLDVADGFHLKLGSGGIREIEFVANALQLIWGGRQPKLRVRHTLTALKGLAAAGHLKSEEAMALSEAYLHLRGLENRLQLIDDGHVHELPFPLSSKNIDAKRLAALCKIDKPEALRGPVQAAREAVHPVFATLFDDAGPKVETTTHKRDLRKSISRNSASILEGWQSGFSDYGIPAEWAGRMAPLAEALCDLVADTSDTDAAISTIETYFRTLPPGGQYLRLLAENPALLADILVPLVRGGAMASLLRHSPHVVDMLIERRGKALTTPNERADLREFVTSQRDYEGRLEAMRAYVNEVLYLAYLAAWRGEISPDKARQLLTEFALEALNATHDFVAAAYPDGSGGLSIAGYGKLGMAEMMPESDLDLVFFAHGDNEAEIEDVQPVHRFSNRLKTALSAEMRGGRIYEIDTRLRPSGASGAPTVRLSTFEDHQMNRAKTWEHLALVPAAFACGPDFARKAFDEVRRAVLTRPRDVGHLVRDAHSMLVQLRDHRISKPAKGTIALKLSPGGMMEVEYLVAFLTLKHAAAHPELADLPYQELAPALEKIDPGLYGLHDAISLLQNAHFCERLYGWNGRAIADLDVKNSGLEMERDELKKALKDRMSFVSDLIKTEITKASGLGKKKLSAFRETAVIWA